jgi:hypothetical protein
MNEQHGRLAGDSLSCGMLHCAPDIRLARMRLTMTCLPVTCAVSTNSAICTSTMGRRTSFNATPPHSALATVAEAARFPTSTTALPIAHECYVNCRAGRVVRVTWRKGREQGSLVNSVSSRKEFQTRRSTYFKSSLLTP